MQLDEHDVKKVSLGLLLVLLAALVFFLIRPVLVSIIAGLILAYIFSSLFAWTSKRVKNKNIAAFLVSGIVLLVIALPLWFVIPIMLEQVFNIYVFFQKASLQSFITSLFPTASEQFIAQITLSINTLINNVASRLLETLNTLFLDLPRILLNSVIVFFVFFFSLRDTEKLKKFVAELSPFSKKHEKAMVQQFKDITDSVVYGQIIIGLVQGGLTGLGLLLFGVNNVLALTVLAIFLSILPIIGPFVIWIPIGIFMLSSGTVNKGIFYIIYNIFIVSLIDNILRTYLVSRKTDISPAIILVAMIGGIFLFGVVGLLLGPLIVAYFITFLKSYRDRTLYGLIADKKTGAKNENN